ncbi:hypothetical protein [Actinomadura fibrosa]|uniref:WD40 repeat domain-containing protein n=1 Tax=Actinomadura fibrosa TaxID=111802 RepID=A0ABW2XP04_9ACTN|nr:hypothetical protein [Actinomadura fibrosa]
MIRNVPAEPLAPGAFDGVAVTAAGDALAFASRPGEGANVGRAWDLATGAPLGPPIPEFPDDGAEWAFGALPGPAGALPGPVGAPSGPVVAWTRRDRVHVHHLRTGAELALDPDRATQPDLIGLAAHGGRGAVVAVFGPAHDAGVVVWDTATGEELGEFGVWLGHWSAIDRLLLHHLPATGPLIALTCDTEHADLADAAEAHQVRVLDVERGEEVARLPSLGCRHAALVPGPETGPGGALVVQPDGADLLVRRLDGERVAALAVPGTCEQLAAASVAGRVVVAAVLRDRPDESLLWDAASPDPSQRVGVPAPVNDLALAHDGTLVLATDEGLYRARSA